MFITYLHTVFNIPSSNGSLVIILKVKTKIKNSYGYKESLKQTFNIFRRSVTVATSFQGPAISGASVALTSQVSESAIFFIADFRELRDTKLGWAPMA